MLSTIIFYIHDIFGCAYYKFTMNRTHQPTYIFTPRTYSNNKLYKSQRHIQYPKPNKIYYSIMTFVIIQTTNK